MKNVKVIENAEELIHLLTEQPDTIEEQAHSTVTIVFDGHNASLQGALNYTTEPLSSYAVVRAMGAALGIDVHVT